MIAARMCPRVSVPAGQRNVYAAAIRLTVVNGTADDQLQLEVSYDDLGRRVESIDYVDQNGVALLGRAAHPVHVVGAR